jgi:uncharacterized protein
MNPKYYLKFEVKEMSDEGVFEGILSPYGNVDAGRDVVEPGAYTKTLKDRGNAVPMLWQHKTEFPIGTLELEDRPDGLWCRGRLAMELPKAQEAFICLKNRIIKGLSIGFETIKDEVKGGVRYLKEIKLYEGSIVTFPMNELAMVTAVKAAAGIKGDFVDELDEILTLSAFYQMQYALGNALSSVVWSESDKEDKIKMVGIILGQFSEAFTDFFPKYLDALEEAYGPSEAWETAVKPEIKTLLAGTSAKFTEFMALAKGRAGDPTLPTQAAVIAVEPVIHSESKLVAILGGIRESIG